jgi:hypothetical protein
MRVEFRGRRIDNNEWVFGDLICFLENDYRIMPQYCGEWDIREAYGVIPHTICQFIEKKWKKICFK